MSDYYGHGGSSGGGSSGGTGSAAASAGGGGAGGYSGGGGYNNRRPQFNKNSNQNNNNPQMDTGKIFVGGLSWQTTEESLRWHFEQYGPVLSVEVMRDRHTGDPRGFAFVVFGPEKAAETVDVVMAADSHEINHKIVDVKRAQARGVAPPSIHKPSDSYGSGGGGGDGGTGGGSSGAGATGGERSQDNSSNQQQQLTPEMAHTKVFVGGIPPQIDRDGLRERLSEFGPVVDAIVMLDQASKRSRGFGFVTFEAGSNGAIKAVQAQPLQMDGRRVEVKLATPRGAGEQQRRPPPLAGPKHVGLRAGQSSSSSSGEFAGLAVAYGRNGWKAGYGSVAFSKSGWAVQGWEDGADGGGAGKAAIERSGFSFSMLVPQKPKQHPPKLEDEPPAKRTRH